MATLWRQASHPNRDAACMAVKIDYLDQMPGLKETIVASQKTMVVHITKPGDRDGKGGDSAGPAPSALRGAAGPDTDKIAAQAGARASARAVARFREELREEGRNEERKKSDAAANEIELLKKLLVNQSALKRKRDDLGSAGNDLVDEKRAKEMRRLNEIADRKKENWIQKKLKKFDQKEKSRRKKKEKKRKKIKKSKKKSRKKKRGKKRGKKGSSSESSSDSSSCDGSSSFGSSSDSSS